MANVRSNNTIQFFSQNSSFSLKNKASVKKSVHSVCQKEKKKAGDINFIFCNDKFLLSLNKKFLKHNTLTDIITFQYPSGKPLSGEIFISIPRVKENAKKFEVSFENELHRVMIHGILHLCGYKDKTSGKKKEMRKKEDHYLLLF
ncbi:MAG: rRNA maturation RNase YbeY [Bacteroidia bacterium]